MANCIALAALLLSMLTVIGNGGWMADSTAWMAQLWRGMVVMRGTRTISCTVLMARRLSTRMVRWCITGMVRRLVLRSTVKRLLCTALARCSWAFLRKSLSEICRCSCDDYVGVFWRASFWIKHHIWTVLGRAFSSVVVGVLPTRSGRS